MTLYNYPSGAEFDSNAPWNTANTYEFVSERVKDEMEHCSQDYSEFVFSEVTCSNTYMNMIRKNFSELNKLDDDDITDRLSYDDELFERVSKFLAPYLLDSYRETRYDDIVSQI